MSSDIFDDIDRLTTEVEVMKGLFAGCGAKNQSVQKIVENLPLKSCYVEVFGGSGVVLLSKPKSKAEVFNDRHSGITDFYRCIADPELIQRLHERLEYTVNSKELFYDYKDSWQDPEDIVERAARWYYSMIYSFSTMGKRWGCIKETHQAFSGKIQRLFPRFQRVHERLKNVQIDNADWQDCLLGYDTYDTVFYLDPPYLNASGSMYLYTMSRKEHIVMLETIFTLKGYVALSGYANDLYDNFPWDEKLEWEVTSRWAQSICGPDRKQFVKDKRVTEILWIKH